MTMDYIGMGKRIAGRRQQMGIKQKAMAQSLGISNNHLSNIERGKEKPSVDILVEICKTLEVTPDYLFMGNMYPCNVPQNIIDGLRLCSQEDITLVCEIVRHMAERRAVEWNGENYI